MKRFMHKSNLITLIYKDFRLEWRNKFALGGVILYLISTVFVTYLAFDGVIEMRTWNALFWLILLFAATNAILKSFIQEGENRQLFYYPLTNAREVIGAKIIYNSALMIVLSLAGLLVFIAFMGNPLQNTPVFLANMLLGTVGLASVLTLVSAIAARAKNNFTLMAILGFPLVLPLLLMTIRVSELGLSGGSFAAAAGDVLIILLIISIAVVLSVLLFPYIWRE